MSQQQESKPKSGLARWLALGGAVAAGVFGFVMNFLGVQDHVCTAPFLQPGIADTCGALGLAGQPTREARLAFEALPAGDCAALQAFRDQFEDSPLRETADSRLNAKIVTEEETWVAGERRLALYAPGASEAEARPRAETQAQALCRGFAATQSFRFVSAASSGAHACEGGACGITGEAVCQLEERQVVARETC